MTTRSLIVSLLVAVTGVFLASGPVAAQQGQGQSGQEQSVQMPPAVQAMMRLRQLQGKLDSIRNEALQKPELESRAKELESQLMDAMSELDPEAQQYMDRLDKLQQAFAAARKRSVTTQMRSLRKRAQPMADTVSSLRNAVFQQQGFQQKFTTFQKRVREQMRQVEPGVDSLRQEAQEIAQKLRKLQKQQQGGARRPAPTYPAAQDTSSDGR